MFDVSDGIAVAAVLTRRKDVLALLQLGGGSGDSLSDVLRPHRPVGARIRLLTETLKRWLTQPPERPFVVATETGEAARRPLVRSADGPRQFRQARPRTGGVH